MIDEDGNRYFVYDLCGLSFDANSETISKNKPLKQVIGYEKGNRVIEILPFEREVYLWTSKGYYYEIKSQLPYCIADNPREICDFEDMLGEKANVIRSTKADIAELARVLFEKTEKKELLVRDNKEADITLIYNPVVAKIVPYKLGKYINEEAYYKVSTYETHFSMEATNVCRDLDRKEYPIYITASDSDVNRVIDVTPLEYKIDKPKYGYYIEELRNIEKELNDKLKIEQQKAKEERINKLVKEIEKEREEKKKAEEAAKRKIEEEKKREEEEKRLEEERKRLQEEAERKKKEKLEKIVNAPKIALDRFNKKRNDQIQKQYEVFKKIAGDNPSKIVTLEDGLEASKKLNDNKKALEKEIGEIRAIVLENLERLSNLGEEVDTVDNKKVRVRIPERELIITVKGRREVNPIYLPHINLIDFSFISSNNLKVSGIDWSKTNIQIDPQKVYKKDLSGCKFSDANIVWKNFDGCNLQNCDISDEVESKGFADIIVDENTKLPKNALGTSRSR